MGSIDDLAALAQAAHDDLDGVSPPGSTLRVFGHDAPLAELASAFESGRLHHAWLLQGPAGIGKATTAFAFARMILARGGFDASHPVPPDPTDPVVRQIAAGTYPGLIHVTRPAAERGGGFRTQITVEEIRKLNRFFQATVARTQYRVAVIDPADDMNRNAANALLKMLEEPPARSLFLIVNHTPGRLLPTIRSRCRLLRFQPLGDDDLAKAVAIALPDASRQDVDAAVGVAEGRVREALSLIAGGGIDTRRTLEQLMAAERPDWNALLSLVDAATSKGSEPTYELTIATVMATIASTGRAMTDAGDGEGADRMARLWHEESRRIREAFAYNLDRKQVALTLFDRFYKARSG